MADMTRNVDMIWFECGKGHVNIRYCPVFLEDECTMCSTIRSFRESEEIVAKMYRRLGWSEGLKFGAAELLAAQQRIMTGETNLSTVYVKSSDKPSPSDTVSATMQGWGFGVKK
jgi:hypothetical protein